MQRQYTGAAGKVTNCQLGVSLSVATRSEHVPIDFELYLPRTWTDDAARRAEARIPEAVDVQDEAASWRWTWCGRACDDGMPRGVLLADAAYGNSSDFRAAAARRAGSTTRSRSNATTTVWADGPAAWARQSSGACASWRMRFGHRRFRADDVA